MQSILFHSTKNNSFPEALGEARVFFYIFKKPVAQALAQAHRKN